MSCLVTAGSALSRVSQTNAARYRAGGSRIVEVGQDGIEIVVGEGIDFEARHLPLAAADHALHAVGAELFDGDDGQLVERSYAGGLGLAVALLAVRVELRAAALGGGSVVAAASLGGGWTQLMDGGLIGRADVHHAGGRVGRAAARGGGAVQVALNEDPYNHTLSNFAVWLLVGSATGIVAAGGLGFVVARAGLGPVQRLTQAVERVAETKDLSQPVNVTGIDEIARLGRSVNSMLAAIDSARQAQRTLVEDASHELRTPMTSIRTNVELLLAVERQPELAYRLPPEDRTKLLQDLDAQVAELATLTTELVDLAREENTGEAVQLVNKPVEAADGIMRKLSYSIAAGKIESRELKMIMREVPPIADIWTMRPNGHGRQPVSLSPRFEFRPDWGPAPRELR